MSRVLQERYELAKAYLGRVTEWNRLYLRGEQRAAEAFHEFNEEWSQIAATLDWVLSQADGENNPQAIWLASQFSLSGADLLDLRQAATERVRRLETSLQAARMLKKQDAEAQHLLSLCVLRAVLGDSAGSRDARTQLEELNRRRGGLGATLYRFKWRILGSVVLTAILGLASLWLWGVIQAANLLVRFNQQLEAFDGSLVQAEEMERTLQSLRRYNREQAFESQNRLYRTLAGHLSRRLQGTVSLEQIDDIRQGIDWLARREPAGAHKLRRALEERQQSWTVVTWAPPYANHAEVFDPSAVHLVNDRPESALAGPWILLPTRQTCSDSVEVEAEYAAGTWESAPSLGVVINCNQGHVGSVRAIDVEPVKRQLATAGEDSTIKLWDLDSGRILRTLRGHEGAVTAVRFVPTQGVLASTGVDRTLRLWDLKTGELRATTIGQQGPVLCLAVAPDGSTLATGGLDRSVQIWDAKTLEPSPIVKKHPYTVGFLAYSPDSKALASGSGASMMRNAPGELQLLTTEGAPLGRGPKHAGAVHGLAFSPDGRILAVGNAEEGVELWDLQSGQLVRTCVIGALPRCLAFAPNSQTLAVGTVDGQVQLHPVDGGEPRRQYYDQAGVQGVCFVDGHSVLALGQRGSVSMFDTTKGQWTTGFSSHGYWISVTPRPQLHPRYFLSLNAHASSSFPIGIVAALGWLATPLTLGEARRLDNGLEVLIVRDGVTVRRQKLPALKENHLRLGIARQGDQLKIQVNDLPALVFLDEFPLHAEPTDVVALLGPGTICPEKIRVMRRGLPAKPTTAELGNTNYAAGRYGDALAYFRAALAERPEQENRSELLCKEAMCLVALKRFDDAEPSFKKVAEAFGERWPVVALSQLGLGYAQQGRVAKARACFAQLTRHPAERVKEVIPDVVRYEVFRASTYLVTPINLVQYQPKRVAELECSLSVLELIDAAPNLRAELKRLLMNAHQLEDRLEPAIELGRELRLNESQPLAPRMHVYSELIWMLVRSDRWAEAEALIPKDLDAPRPAREDDLLPLLERARLRARQGQWQQAAKDLDRFDRLFTDFRLQRRAEFAHFYLDACTLRGFSYEALGNEPRAQQAWSQGFAFARQTPGQWGDIFASILGSLTQLLKEQDAAAMMTAVLRGLTGDKEETITNVLQRSLQGPQANASQRSGFGIGSLKPSAYAPELRALWKSERGWKSARRLALHDVSYRDYHVEQVKLFLAETCRIRAVGDLPDPTAQDAVIWNLVCQLYEGYSQTPQQINNDHLIAMVFCMFPEISFNLGGKSLPEGLPIKVQAPLAYVFGHRNRRLGRFDTAEKFFDTALAAAPDSNVRSLAQSALRLLPKK